MSSERKLIGSRGKCEEREIKRPLVSWEEGKNDFIIEDRSYQQQFSDIYFIRLLKLKAQLEEIASEAWNKLEVC
jgi:hypothetical protein